MWATLCLAVGASVLAGVHRLLPPPLHPLQFTMIGALGIWGGARLRPWLGLTLPILVWVITDLILWQMYGYPYFNPFVYGSFVAYGLLGLTLRNSHSPARIGVTTLAGSLIFFLVTNFGVWVASWKTADQVPEGKAFIVGRGKYDHPEVHYSADIRGLVACYALAVPFIQTEIPPPAPLGFFGNTIAGDLFFCGVLFGLQALVLRLVTRRQPELASVANH
jgi:hypothetical protein